MKKIPINDSLMSKIKPSMDKYYELESSFTYLSSLIEQYQNEVWDAIYEEMPELRHKDCEVNLDENCIEVKRSDD